MNIVLAIALIAFTVLSISLRLVKNYSIRQSAFLICNLGLMTWVFYQDSLLMAGLSIILVIIHFSILQLKTSRISEFLAYSVPVIFFCVHRNFTVFQIVGFSYICFRMLSASHELKAGVVQRVGIRDYLSYCFFFPTLKVGPIGSLKDHLESMNIQDRKEVMDLNWPQLARITFGAVKYLFLAAYIKNISSAFGVGEWGNAKQWYDLILIGFSSYIVMYLSFSGFNDIAIGICDFLGFRMKENFLRPFTAKNVSEFWSNWHVSLTDLLKELLFIPLNLHLLRKVGREKKPLVVSFSMLILFFVVGVWHGKGMNFVYLGLYHAGAAIVAYHFSLLMVKIVPSYKSYKSVQYAGLVLTQTYFALSFLIMENNVGEIEAILRRISGM